MSVNQHEPITLIQIWLQIWFELQITNLISNLITLRDSSRKQMEIFNNIEQAVLQSTVGCSCWLSASSSMRPNSEGKWFQREKCSLAPSPIEISGSLIYVICYKYHTGINFHLVEVFMDFVGLKVIRLCNENMNSWNCLSLPNHKN